MKIKKNICVGSGLISLDILIKNNDYRNLTYYVGGSCGNVLMILSFLGWETYPIARLSQDKNANRIVSDLNNNNVNLSYVSISDHGSTPVIIQKNIYDKYGNPKHKFELKDPFTGRFLPRFKPITKEFAIQILQNNISPNVFYFDRLAPGILLLAKEYKKRGGLIVFEPSSIGDENKFVEAMKVVDILKFSNQRIINYGEFFPKSPVPLEIETLGEDGLKYRCNYLDGEWHTLTADRKIASIIDSSGAGDWTTSGIIYHIEEKYDRDILNMTKYEVEETLNFAQKLGALNCLYEGARGLMSLTKEEIFSQLFRS